MSHGNDALPDELQELCNELGITVHDNADLVQEAARALYHDGVLSQQEYWTAKEACR